MLSKIKWDVIWDAKKRFSYFFKSAKTFLFFESQAEKVG